MNKIYVVIFMILMVVSATAQDARSLIEEGNQLNSSKDYAGAIVKYKLALNVDPGNTSAKYQMAFVLNTLGKKLEAVPYLQDVLKSSPSPTVAVSAYALLASIFDSTGSPLKAIESYKEAIKIDSAYYALQYGLGLAYFRANKYANAEITAIEAYLLDTSKAEAMRLYGLVTFHQDKRAPALLALCTFLYMDPQGNRSNEANENIDHILQGGTLKVPLGTTVSKVNSIDKLLNQALNKAANSSAQKGHSSQQLLFNEQLKSVFLALAAVPQEKSHPFNFQTQLIRLFQELGSSVHMTTFAYYIRQQSNKGASAWLAKHPPEVNAMKNWMNTTKYRLSRR